MGLVGRFRGFVRALRSGTGPARRPLHRGDAVADAAGDAMGMEGTPGADMSGDGPLHYNASFDDD